MPTLIDLTGQTFGRLTVAKRVGVPYKQAAWLCRCTCGGESVVAGCSLRAGHTSSCGCEEGYRKHGQSYSAEYRAWVLALSRCHNPRNTGYHLYGARGIVVCESWRASFDAFLADIGPKPSARHSLDRVDVDGPYAPSNCRWATPLEQGANKRNNRRITVHGETLTIAQASRKYGRGFTRITRRLDAGRTPEEAVR